MSATYVSEGLVQQLKSLANGHMLYLGLYTGTPTISEDMDFYDITEASFTGYARVELNEMVLTITWNSTDHRAQGDFSPVRFQATSSMGLPQTVSGWFIAATNDGGISFKLMMIKPFDSGPFTFNTTSDYYDLSGSVILKGLAAP